MNLDMALVRYRTTRGTYPARLPGSLAPPSLSRKGRDSPGKIRTGRRAPKPPTMERWYAYVGRVHMRVTFDGPRSMRVTDRSGGWAQVQASREWVYIYCHVWVCVGA